MKRTCSVGLSNIGFGFPWVAAAFAIGALTLLAAPASLWAAQSGCIGWGCQGEPSCVGLGCQGEPSCIGMGCASQDQQPSQSDKSPAGTATQQQNKPGGPQQTKGVQQSSPSTGATGAERATQQVKPVEPCCSVSAVDAKTGIVTARDSATGRTFQFKTNNPAVLNSVKAGQPIHADFKTGQVSVQPDGVEPCCNIVNAGPPSTVK